jgi:predicted metal-dependent HD superfamily phosphohydrolase
MTINLEELFKKRWNQYNIHSVDRQAPWDHLTISYADRPYHNLQHVTRCIEEARKMAALSNYIYVLDLIELALFAHDWFYVPNYHNNEVNSFHLITGSLGLHKDDYHFNQLYEMIMITKHEDKPCINPDANLVADCDLAGLADPWDVFVATGEAIRQEFGAAPKAFGKGRALFFIDFLKRRSIFRTEIGIALYEQKARDNIGRWLREYVDRVNQPIIG